MRIIQLTTVHPWDDIRIYHKISRSLVAAGYEVHLLASHPGGGKCGDSFEGLQMHWLPSPRSRLGRIINIWRSFKIVCLLRPDFVHFHDPELMLAAIPLRFLGFPVIYDVHEDYPDTMLEKYWIAPQFRRLASWGVRFVEWLFSRWIAARVVVATPHIGRRFPQEKRVLVQNFPIKDEFAFLKEEVCAEASFDFVYAGSICRQRGAIEMVEAAKIVQDKGYRAHLWLVGLAESAAFSAELNKVMAGAPVTWPGKVSRTEMAGYLGRALASLVVLHPVGNYVSSQPNKLFEAMSAGVPVVASNFPTWRVFIDSARCGVLVDPLDPMSIADGMIQLIKNPNEAKEMGDRGRLAVQSEFNWENESDRLLAMYGELASEV